MPYVVCLSSSNSRSTFKPESHVLHCTSKQMAFALPVWLAVQEELLGHDGADCAAPSIFDDFDDDALFQMFHLTRPCIAFITDAVRIRMKNVALKKPALSVDATVMVALNYYAHGVSSAEVLQRVGPNQADSLAAICTVSEVIAGMADQFISFPLLREAKTNVASKIRKVCGIPYALGVLAPAHFKIRASPYEKETFRSFVNTLGYTSVVSQIICDSDGNILSVEKCCVGSTFEQEMWESSFKGREMEEELHGPYWVIGGKGYRLSKHVLTPVSEPANDGETRFNEAHAKIHNVMRTMLGSMKRRFRCLMQLGFAQECSLVKKANIIKACSVLHNIAKKFSVPPPPVAGKIEPLHPGKQHSVPVAINPEALQARQELIRCHFSIASTRKDPLSKAIMGEDA
ncbi:putative nuclease HARBI1 [Anarhichas minor]|uniref:putative nuclease HARBI1 n=1 Tax=Anarhichas minor TaxID=65739 RepID=UPI003F7315E5